MSDPESLSAEAWLPGDFSPQLVSEQLVWEPPGAVPPLAISLAGLFEPI